MTYLTKGPSTVLPCWHSLDHGGTLRIYEVLLLPGNLNSLISGPPLENKYVTSSQTFSTIMNALMLRRDADARVR